VARYAKRVRRESEPFVVALKVAVDIGPVVRAIGASTGAQCRRGRRRAQASDFLRARIGFWALDVQSGFISGDDFEQAAQQR